MCFLDKAIQSQAIDLDKYIVMTHCQVDNRVNEVCVIWHSDDTKATS